MSITVETFGSEGVCGFHIFENGVKLRVGSFVLHCGSAGVVTDGDSKSFNPETNTCSYWPDFIGVVVNGVQHNFVGSWGACRKRTTPLPVYTTFPEKITFIDPDHVVCI